MERWEVGDIASKVGQLYYNYYLRTSEARFLHEAYVFYEAVRGRAYFAGAATDPSLAIKQLRYFARFIIVCLLLNRRDEVQQLLQEFQALVTAYGMKFRPPDAGEWRAVVQEVSAFLAADVALPAARGVGSASAASAAAGGTSVPFRLSLRAAPGAAEVKAGGSHRMLLRDAVLVSYYPRQVKIAELPLDTFRMLQALEWEDAYTNPATAAQAASSNPVAAAMARGAGGQGATTGGGGGGAGGGGATGGGGAKTTGGGGGGGGGLGALPTHGGGGGTTGGGALTLGLPLENPSKHLVYRPTSMQLLAILTTTVEVMPRDAVLLLYLSAQQQQAPPGVGGGGGGGGSSAAAVPASVQMGGSLTPGSYSAAGSVTGAPGPRGVLPLAASSASLRAQAAGGAAGGGGGGGAGSVGGAPTAGPGSSSLPDDTLSEMSGGAPSSSIVTLSAAAGGAALGPPLLPLPLSGGLINASSAAAAAAGGGGGPGGGPGGAGGGGRNAAGTLEGINLGPPRALDAATDAFLVPEDLVHLTRRTLVLVVEADSAAAFLRLQGTELGRQAFGLLSPPVRPAELGDAGRTGALMTMFLTGPLMAACVVAGNADPSTQQLVDAQSATHGALGSWAALAARAFAPGGPAAKSPWAPLFQDALLRRLVLRFVLCRAMLALHATVGQSAAHLPRAFPGLPRELAADAPEVAAGVARIAAALGRADAFADRPVASTASGSPMSAATHH